MESEWDKLRALATQEVEDTLKALPGPLLEKAQAVPVTFQPCPNDDQCRDGIEPDTLGLFVGPEYAEEPITAAPLPAQIILFLGNLWDFAGQDEEIFCEEVHTTYLHELGHYLGLDEDDLFDRDLQ